MSTNQTAKVRLWCHVCRRLVEHHAAHVEARKGLARVLYVTPAVLDKHRATHDGEAA